MTADPRAALATLVAALERHLELAASRRDADDPAVGAAAEAVIEAFDDYDEALFDTTGVATPLGVYSDDDEEDEDEEDEDEEDEDEETTTKRTRTTKRKMTDEEDDEDEEDEDEDEEDEDEADEPADPRDPEDQGGGMYAGLDDEDIDFDDEESEGDE